MSHWKGLLIASALAVVVGLPGAVLAGGWLVMTLDALPAGSVAVGQEVALGFVARQHGRQPLAGVGPIVTFTHRESGQRLTVRAVDEGAPGHYVARFSPPAAGAWEWTISAWNADHPMPPLTVVPGAASPTTTTSQPQPGPDRWLLLAAAAVLAILGVAGLLVAGRQVAAADRRPPAIGARAPIR